MTDRARAAFRYATTYLVLLKQFALDRGSRFWAMLAAVVLNAFIHPIPFLLIAEILRSTQVGGGKIALGWRGLSVTVQPDLGVLMVFLIGAGSFLFSYFVSRWVGREIVAWQGVMFWRLMGGIGRIARWDRPLELGTILQATPVAARLDGALRGAFPIGRLIETGTRDFVMILALGGMLVWQDPRDTAVLTFLSLLFLPAYALALTRLVRMQSKSNAQQGKLLLPVVGIITSEVSQRPGQRLDGEEVSAQATEQIARGFGSQSHLLNEQNAMTVVAGVHVFAAFYGVYLSEGQSLAMLPASKLSSLFFLVLLLRSLTGLIGLLSRLSRGYERLGQLRALLHPVVKPGLAERQEPGRFDIEVPVQSGMSPSRLSVGPGDCIVYLAPDVSYDFQLLPLSNAMGPRFNPDQTTIRHIVLLGPEDVPALLANQVVAGERQQLRVPLAGSLPLQPDPVDLSRAPVVALGTAAFQRLLDSDALAAAGKGRILILAVAGRTLPRIAPDGALVALSDGRRLIAVGDSELVAAKLEVVNQRSAARPESDDEEEPGIGDV